MSKQLLKLLRKAGGVAVVEKASIDEAYMLVTPRLEQGRLAAQGELPAGVGEAAGIARRIKQSGRRDGCSCCMCCSRPAGRAAVGFSEMETFCKAFTGRDAGCSHDRTRWPPSDLELLLHAVACRPTDPNQKPGEALSMLLLWCRLESVTTWFCAGLA